MATLKVGDKAPAFVAQDQNDATVSSASLQGKKVILYFYPKDSTPGCTAEAKSMRDGQKELSDAGFVVIGVSPDSVRSHQNFHAKQELNFTLLSDPDKVIANAYGVWGEKQFMGRTVMGIKRTTFVIDEKGVIERIFDKVQTKTHSQQILESYK